MDEDTGQLHLPPPPPDAEGIPGQTLDGPPADDGGPRLATGPHAASPKAMPNDGKVAGQGPGDLDDEESDKDSEDERSAILRRKSHRASGVMDEAVHLKIMRPYAMYPQRMCPAACCVHCFLFLLFIILFIAVGPRFLFFTTDVALHLWENKWKVRLDALREGDKIATFDLSSMQAQTQQEIQRLPAGSKEYKLELVYNAKDGNMLTVDKLRKVKELEDFIVSRDGYSKHCLRAPGSTKCQDAETVLRACQPQLCGFIQNREGGVAPQTGCGARNAQGMTPASDCSPAKSFPSGLLNCNSPSCPRSAWQLEAGFMVKKVSQYATATFLVDMPETMFLASTDAQFGAGVTTASALRSKFSFGFPLEGFSNNADRPEEQKKQIEQFMKDAYFEKVDKWNENNADEDFLIGYIGGPLMSESTNKLLMGDFSLVALAFIVVYTYLLLMTQSVFYSTMALAQIFLSFATGFLLYRLLFGASFFGVFHIMAIFLLLGVGVDDVFVFLDHFEAATQVKDEYREDAFGRISWTWKHAATAMGVTSLTTATSFFMNGISSFPGIASFGIFAGCLVVVLYTSMVFFWPAVVMFNHKYFRDKPFLCGIPDKIASLKILRRIFENTSEEAKEDTKWGEAAEKPLLVRFFEDHFSKFILRFRCCILVIFAAISIFMFVQISKLTPERTPPELLPEQHPIQQYFDLMTNVFVRGGSVFNTKVDIIMGFDKDPLDRDGTDATGAGFGEDPDTVGTLGKVRWNPNFVGSSGATNANVIMGGFDCFVQLCDSAEVVDSDRNTGGLPAYQVSGCFPRDVQRFMKQSDPGGWQAKWTAIVDGNSSEFQQQYNMLAASDPKWAQDLELFTYAEKVNSMILWRYFRAQVTLTSDSNMEHTEGLKLAEKWEDWLSTELGKGSCASVSNTFFGFISSKDFAQFKVVESLLSEMRQGIAVSLCVALVILVLVTGNIVIGGLAAFTIAMIVLWVMAMIPSCGWELGIVENIVLVMVPGLSVDFTAHLAEAYNNAKYEDREHRVVHALEHSGVSIVSGAVSTALAGICLLFCQIVFFVKFGALILFTVLYAVIFSLFFFPSLMALFGPRGNCGDWHRLIHPLLQRRDEAPKNLRVKAHGAHAIQMGPDGKETHVSATE